MSLPYTPIDCGDYDFIEIACMYGYRLDVVLESKTMNGKAVTTEKNTTGEYLILEIEDKTREMIRVDKIKKFVVLDENARFREHKFRNASS